MQAHVRFENDKAFCLANVFRCVFIPTVWIKNPQDFYWLIKGGQLSNVVFDPYPFEAYVCLYMLRF